MNPLRSIITRILPKAWFSPYEAANHSPRRGRVPGAAPRDAKLDLLPGTRRELVRRSRYLHKNSGFVRELVGSMAIYATGDGIKPQALSPSPEWNKAAEEYFARWAAHCEITNRFCFAECQALVCRGMDVDGKYFVHKARNADGGLRLQLIESHRIGDADRGDTEARLFQRGIDSVLRLHPARKASFREGRRLGKDDRLITWQKPAQRTDAWSLEEWEALPAELSLRLIRLHVSTPGFRTQSVTLVTTLTEANTYPADEIRARSGQRWEVELHFHQIKILLGLDPFDFAQGRPSCAARARNSSRRKP